MNNIAPISGASLKDFIGQPKSTETLNHSPRVLILYGSIRNGSISKMLAVEAMTLLQSIGAEVRIFNPEQLPVFDSASTNNSRVIKLRELAIWSEAMVWCSPEVHGNFTGVFKNQIDWLPLSTGSIRPTQGKTLALMQISGGSQSFNVVNNMRILGRWMRMFTIPNQSSIPKAHQEFDDAGKMKPSAFRDRVIDVLQELVKMTLLLRQHSDWLTHRYSENKLSIAPLSVLCCSNE
ncbi:arsenical resistance protein ArsH [Shewanella sp. 10N.286.45.A1]|uniref:arsenical resistance protein ArsH n=1 Tax=Shewanella sp. 10N.286.45.A1 TaxID=3229694 RepID=UPI00354C35B1